MAQNNNKDARDGKQANDHSNTGGHDDAPVTAAVVSSAAAASSIAEGESTLGSKAATVAVIGLGVALIEAELIPGMIIGAAAMLAPDVLPKLGRGLRPFVKGLMKAGYSLTERARETVAEASEQLQDIAAEVKAEQSHPTAATGAPTRR